MENSNAKELIDFINKATTPYHTVKEGKKLLDEAKFTQLNVRDEWDLQPGENYYVTPFATSLFAFTIGDDWEVGQNIRIGAAHTDSPGFRVKPNGEMASNGYLKLNTEVYGGPIINTWLDRPLSLAGKVATKSDDPFKPSMQLFDVKEALITIPNLPVHFNREVNKGIELNKQIDTLPLFSMENEDTDKDKFFIEYIAKEIDVKKEEILDYDIYVYSVEEGTRLGMNKEFISSPRLDNLTSVLALLKAIIKGVRREGVNLIALYDNEEIGSRSKQGADSSTLNLLIEKIFRGLKSKDEERLFDIALDSMLLSVDVAHGTHPNRPDKYDPSNKTKLNQGIIIKIDSNQKYAFDTEAVAIVQQICEKSGIKYQKFVNRSDVGGGGTLGSIISSWLPIKTVDLGVPLLAMHSARETMGLYDQTYLENLLSAFFGL